MPIKRILATLLCVTRTVIESMKLEDGKLIICVSPRKGQRCRCPHCNRKSPVYDCSAFPRRWRTLDLGATITYLQYHTLRIRCPEHGVVTAAVPWAHHASRFTHAFEEQVAWLCVHCNRGAIAQLMRIDWKSVGPVCKRVYDRLDAASGNHSTALSASGLTRPAIKKGTAT